MRKSSTFRDSLNSGRRQVVILLILIMKRITDRMLPRGTPNSCSLGSENVLFTHVWKAWSSRMCYMKESAL